jgi:hypothetical protein
MWNKDLDYLMLNENLIENVKAKKIYEYIDKEIKV